MSTERYPWRYRCPTCGSVQVTRYSGVRMPSRNELLGRKLHHSGNLRTGITAIPKYHCDNCHAKFDTPKDMLISGSTPESRKQQDPAEATIHSRAKAAELFSNNTHVTTPPNFCGHYIHSEKISRPAGGLVLFRAPQSHGQRPPTMLTTGALYSFSFPCGTPNYHALESGSNSGERGDNDKVLRNRRDSSPGCISSWTMMQKSRVNRGCETLPVNKSVSSHLSSARSERCVISAEVEGSNPSGGFQFNENLRKIEN